MSDYGEYQLPPSTVVERLHERKMDVPMKQSCVCGASWEGSARDVIEAARLHREELHPQMVDRTQKVRRAEAKDAPVSYWTGRSSLGEM